uniref:hypothetical protein n=1 Tax=Roseovarius sp. BRH_c41 TaxID=1629709 RepID=UPI000A52AFE9|nr:hypothetical protein [Roseovarius sp. BRH_c41]
MRHNMQDFIKAGQVVYVAADGVAHCGKAIAAAERARVADLLARATPPDACGPEMPVAPARGPMLAFTPRKVVQTEAGNYRSVSDGYVGRQAARVADAFDNITRKAFEAHEKLGGGDAAFVPPFSVGQVEIGREYAALVERVASSGLGCVSLETSGGGGGNGGEGVQAAVFRDIERLRMLRRRMDTGLARKVRRERPNGDKRRSILVRVLVDQVCVHGMSLDAVLRAHGWGINTRCRDGLRSALCGALDRMRGFDLVRPTK